MVRQPLYELAYTRCPSCDGHTAWTRSAREIDGIAYRRRRCLACGAVSVVVIGVVTDNPILVDALGWYHDNAGGTVAA